MKKNIRFNYLCDVEERQMLRDIAESLQMSQGASIRSILRKWAECNQDKEKFPLSGSCKEDEIKK